MQELSQAGKLALGSDSRLSGEFDLLAELRAAHQTGQLSPQALFRSVTLDAARLLRLREGGRGRIVPGGPADLVLLPPPAGTDPFARLLDLTRARIELVLLAGQPAVGSPRMQPVFEAARTRFGSVTVDGTEKLLSQALIERVRKSSVGERGLQV
ncbi:MAG: amidohydrolase family protein [Anaerolineales bacterium]|nr:amidohydrolase family protein [Anaerolineales bacterium]